MPITEKPEGVKTSLGNAGTHVANASDPTAPTADPAISLNDRYRPETVVDGPILKAA